MNKDKRVAFSGTQGIEHQHVRFLSITAWKLTPAKQKVNGGTERMTVTGRETKLWQTFWLEI